MPAVLAEFERDLCPERAKKALALKRRRGECVGRVPYGRRREGDRWVAHSAEQKNLAVLRSVRKRGLTYRAIAEALSRRGLATTQSQARWHAKPVRRLLARDGKKVHFPPRRPS